MNPLNILAGVMVFTNTISFTTNSNIKSFTNKDSVFGDATFLSLSSDNAIDSNGNTVTSITNSGIYAIKSPDGWGYQSYVKIPDPATGFTSYITPSLAYEGVTNIVARAVGNPSDVEKMFSTKDSSTTNYVRNTEFWLSDCPQITGIVIAQGTTVQNNQIGGSAISPRHVINCGHAPFSTGTKLLFLDDSGDIVIRSVISSTNYGLNVNDINVALLDSDLPSSVHYFSVFYTNIVDYLPTLTNALNLPVIGMNQDETMFPKILYKYGSTLYFSSSTLWVTNNDWNVVLRSGDSGHPLMFLLNTNLILLSHWTTEASGPSYIYWYNTINYAMHYLSTNNSLSSDYQLTTFDLSGYLNYSDVTNQLAAQWKFNAGGGLSDTDSSGNGNTITLVNGPTWGFNDDDNALLSFDGVDDYCSVANDSSLNVGDTMSISVWVKPTSDLSQRHTIYASSDQDGGMWLEIGSSPTATIEYTNGIAVGKAGTWICMVNNCITSNQWNHIVYIRAGSGDTHSVYVNGVKYDRNSVGDISNYDPTTSFPADPGDPRLVGARTKAGSFGVGRQFFKGEINDLRIYSTNLTDVQAHILDWNPAQ